MIRTVEAVIDEQGNVRLLEPVHPRTARRAFVLILDEGPADRASEAALLSEVALAWIPTEGSSANESTGIPPVYEQPLA